ncbi:MAG: polysaccharide deacetylase family protein, partial [Clostridia bacterium]|nr:polysaccharide deacetylase family protein [Clostridia bacterium]
MKAVRFLCLAVLFILLCPAALCEGQAIPDVLRFSQTEEERVYLRDQVYTVITLPTTANETVTAEMRALLQSMHTAGSAHIPDGRPELMAGYLDTGAQIFRTGTKWMSFLSISSIAWEREQIYVDFDARAYDMETGRRLSLWDVVTTDALSLLASEVRTGLTGYFSTLQADETVLNGLCSPQVLLNTPFTLSPGRLTLHYRADLLYPGRNQLMHVSVPYSALAPYLTEEAKVQTDNSGYSICALTFDDGPAGAASIRVLNLLRRYGAQSSFFLVGSNMYNYHYVVCREHDALQDVESHNWVHVYEDLSTENVMTWKDKFDKLLDEIIGLKPAYMRAPG